MVDKSNESELLNILKNIRSENLCKKWEGECGTEGIIHRDGPVGIGTFQQCFPPLDSDILLGVRDGILTEQYKVCEDFSWCDYVFDEDYNLLPLSEVNSFITKSGHLPNMPSEAEIIADNGFEMLDISIRQQEKIEEAFLYLISVNEKLEQSKKMIEELRP